MNVAFSVPENRVFRLSKETGGTAASPCAIEEPAIMKNSRVRIEWNLIENKGDCAYH
jgi:hypothetical protein